MATAGPPQKKAARGGLKFLVVDDDTYYANQLTHLILKASGQSDGVHIVGSVSAALNKIDNEAYDVCFVDFDLIDQAGLHTDEVSHLSKTLTATVFLSEKPCKEAALRALQVGAKDFLIKSSVSDFDIAKSIAYALFWKYREIEMEAHAVRDHVTGLGNVPLFDEHLRHALEVAKRGKEKVGLLMIGLDGMEPVYEDYGDEVSDELLKQVAERISGKLRTTDVVARLDDDEFGAILGKVASPAVVETISGTLAGTLSDKPYSVNGYTLKIGASVGASTYPDDGKSGDDLKGRAQASMTVKKAKKLDKTIKRPAFSYYR